MVLGAAGLGKGWRPRAATQALRTLGLPSSNLAARVLGAGELALAVAVIGRGGWWLDATLGLAFLALAFAAWRLRASDGSGAVSCGCFGRSTAPVGLIHVVVNLGAVVFTGAAALAAATPSLGSVWPDLPAFGVVHLLLVAAGAAAVIATLTVLPETRQLAKVRVESDPRIHLFGPTISRRPGRRDVAGPADGRL